MIFGPYDNKGQPIVDGFDVCNGMMVDTNGDGVQDSYSYIMTQSFPYFLGCIGPGNFPSYAPECTTNPAPLLLNKQTKALPFTSDGRHH